ncbi:hypothetical protein V5O48_016549 [Marasmius crinis-equi]|uniref:Nephrocystin 3-like N-terminal domain-containing protein n=1 Tax=Marasmius crinis-equi TaxID=585013 RepID=A0ABR3ERK2_9AGAR
MSSPGGDGSVPQATEHARVVHSPTSIGLIKPQRIDHMGDNPERFTMLVKSKGGETLREAKWDSDRGGWFIGLVQIRGLATENLSFELQELRFAGILPWTIACEPLTMKEVESAIHASQNQLELSITINSQDSLNVTDKKLVLIVEISTPSLLPLWIASINLAEPVDGVTDQILKTLDLVFKSGQGKQLKKSAWNSSHRCWNVDLPQLRGEATEHLFIELRGRGRTGRRKSLATVTLDIEESEQARKESKKEISKTFIISPNSGPLNLEELVLVIQFGAIDMAVSDTDRVALPRSVAQILEDTTVITDVLEKLSGMLQEKRVLDGKLVDLVDSMNQLYGCATVKDALRNYATFQVLFDAMIQQSVECFLFISNYVSDGYLRHMTRVSEEINRFKSSFENLKTRFNDDLLRTNTVINMETNDLVVGLHKTIQRLDHKLDLHDMKRLLEEELGTTEFQLPSDLPRCLLGTRQHTLSKILDWIVCGKQSLLWVSGIAGSGKSSIMATLHDYLDKMGRNSHLAAYIRFRRSRFESPSKFVLALIYQLATFDSGIGAEIVQAMRRNILHLPLSDQFQSLVVRPLKKHKPKIEEETQIVVLIDGLDECMQEAGGSNAFHDLLDLLSHLASSHTFHAFPFLRFIVASRPEEPIHNVFAQSSKPDNDPNHPNIAHFRLDTSSSETTADILRYLTVKFEEMFRKNSAFRDLCEQEKAVPRFAESSHGLFIWVSVVVRFLRLAQNRERLQAALDIGIPQNASAFDVLKELYRTVLDNVAAEHSDDDVKAHICNILGLVIAAGRVQSTGGSVSTLNENILRGLLEYHHDKVDDILSLLPRLGAVIEGAHSPDAELLLLHKSFEDYLTDKSRAGHPWHIDVKGHWIPKVTEFCVHMVHSNVFSDPPETSEALSFAHHYWTRAFAAQLDRDRSFPTECELSRILLKVLQRGLLRWAYSTYLLNRDLGTLNVGVFTAFGLKSMLAIKQIPSIVGGLCRVFGNEFGMPIEADGRLSTTLQRIFIALCLYPEETSGLRKYLPQFSNIASGSRDFWTVLDTLQNTDYDSTNFLDRLEPTDTFEHEKDGDSLVYSISGVPRHDILEEMNNVIRNTGGLDLSHYQRPSTDA